MIEAAAKGWTVTRLASANPELPFPAAVRVGPWIMLSGEIGVGRDGRLADGLDAQTQQTLRNIEATLGRFGADRSHVVRCLVMLRRMDDWARFNLSYLNFFHGHPLPARSAFGATALALDAEVEIECVAFVPGAGRGDHHSRITGIGAEP